MKKQHFLFSLLLFFSFAFYGQTKTSTVHKTDKSKQTPQQKQIIYTAIKPADGQPAVFGSIEEKDASVPGKINNVYVQIANNATDTARVRLLRMELWRLQNATVLAPH